MAARKKKPVLEPWSGPERWQSGPVGPAGCFLEILPFTEQRRELRNDLGDRWIETRAEIEDRRKKLWKGGAIRAPIPGAGGTLSERSIRGASLAADIASEAEVLGAGDPDKLIPLTTLRWRVERIHPHHRTDFDEAVAELLHDRKVALAAKSGSAVTSDDKEDAVWVGDEPKHLLRLVHR